MINCLNCGGFIKHDSSNLSSLCMKCAGKLTEGLAIKERLAMAKVGLDALVDEATGYQEVRPKDDLAKRHEKYKEGK